MTHIRTAVTIFIAVRVTVTVSNITVWTVTCSAVIGEAWSYRRDQ